MKYETRLIWVLGITFGFVFFDRNAAAFLMPFIASDLHFSNTQIGWIASALSFTWAVSGVLGGAYADRTPHRKRLLLMAVVAFSLCSFLSGLAASFVTLFLARLLMGMAEPSLGGKVELGKRGVKVCLQGHMPPRVLVTGVPLDHEFAERVAGLVQSGLEGPRNG